MSLTTTDLGEIRNIVHEEVGTVVREEVQSILQRKLEPLESEIKALRNNIKEIYDMIKELRGGNIAGKDFQKLSTREKILKLNAELLMVAKQEGITLPR